MKSSIQAGESASIELVPASPAGDPENVEMAALTASLGYLLRRLQLAYKKHFTRVAGPAGVQANQVGAMFAIGLNPDITPSQLCVALGMDAAQVTTMLNQLEVKKLIKRKSSKVDGRSRAVTLTAAGEKLFRTTQATALEAEQTFTKGILDEAEAQQLVALLSRLLAGRPE